MIKTSLTALGLCLFTSMAFVLPQAVRAGQSASEPGATRIATWKDDKKAAFMMFFDDGCPTHVTNVFPELVKRGLTGTYYIIPGKGEYKSRLAFWEKEAPATPGVVYGNHTTTAGAFKSAEHAEEVITGCSEVIHRVFPGKRPRLISYVSPGGMKHAITQAEIDTIIARHHLVLRPPFKGHGAGIHFKTADDILRAVDNTAVGGGKEYVIFHGVGGDWLKFDLGEFIKMLDGLEARRGDLWITDHISAHKYETAVATASVKVLQTGARAIRLELRSQADAAFYDEPLTLVTHVPASWIQAHVTQGNRDVTVPVTNGTVRYEALPGPDTILVEAR